MKLFKNQKGFSDVIVAIFITAIIGSIFIMGTFIWQELNYKDSIFIIPSKNIAEGQVENVEDSIDVEVSFKTNTVYTLKDYNEENYIILDKDGVETIIEKASSDPVKNIAKSFSFIEPEFSNSGKYLTYKAVGWEWVIGKVYDVYNNQELLSLGSMTMNGFTYKEDYFYACSRNDFSGEDYIKIYSVPNFELVASDDGLAIFDGMPGYFNCSYNTSDNSLMIVADNFSLSDKNTLIYKYNFQTQEFIEL
ncbi:MAG: hypothetical protein Q8O32_02500 [bacterium]|nr:hypothetical protein [bacterium]